MDTASIEEEQKMYAAFEKAASSLEAMNKFLDEKSKESEKFKVLSKCFSDFEKVVVGESKSSSYTRDLLAEKMKDWQRPKYVGACKGNPQEALVTYLKDVLKVRDGDPELREDKLEDFASLAFTNNKIVSILNNSVLSNYREALPAALKGYFGTEGGADIEKLATEAQQALVELHSVQHLVDSFMLLSPERMPIAMKTETVTSR